MLIKTDCFMLIRHRRVVIKDVILWLRVTIKYNARRLNVFFCKGKCQICWKIVDQMIPIYEINFCTQHSTHTIELFVIH